MCMHKERCTLMHSIHNASISIPIEFMTRNDLFLASPVDVHKEFRIHLCTCVFVMAQTYTFTRVEGKGAREVLAAQVLAAQVLAGQVLAGQFQRSFHS